jgi:anti-sigma factor ChrR (cupin superfamily)
MNKPVEDLPLDEKIASGRSHLVDVVNMPWTPSPFPGIDQKVLFNDPASGMSTVLVRMQPGAAVPLHEHMGIEQAFVLEGSVKDHDGEVTAGNYTWRDKGNKHVNVSPNGAIVLGIFTKPNVFYGGATHIADFKKDPAKA